MSPFRFIPVVTGLIFAGGIVVGQGIEADTSVGTVTLASFEDMTSPDVWAEVNRLPYWAIPLDPPSNYYDDVDPSSADTLRSTLHAIIDDQSVFRYTHPTKPGDENHKVDTWDIVALADAHPEQPARVLDVYLNNTFTRQLKGNHSDPHYDREHSWPKSYGFKKDTTKNSAYSDCHHLFAAYSSYNSSRSDKPYGTSEQDPDKRRHTLENLGRGGALSDEPDSSNYSFTNVWQTWIGRRGDVARAMFYLDARYEGGRRWDGNFEPDLQLTDTIDDIETLNDAWETGGSGFMGLKSVLLVWHKQDPVDDLERRHNAVVYLFQGNRNPFIDHPEWVTVIFGGGDADVPLNANVWINEIHYDNHGTDTGEFAEIAGPAGLDLTNWTLIGYNGSGGRTYNTVALFGTIQEQQNGFGVAAFNFSPMQNGPPDGLALVDPTGATVQFISYGGHFTGGDGHADGMVATDIGVKESGSTPVGHSLQLTGQGLHPNEFRWTGPVSATRGLLNVGQEFVPHN